MRKKLLTFLLLFVLLFSFTACSEKEDASVSDTTDMESTNDNNNTETNETKPNTEGNENITEEPTSETKETENEFSCEFRINDEVYQIPMWYSEFEERGWEYQGNSEETLYYYNYSYDAWTKGGMRYWTHVTNLSPNAKSVQDSVITSISIDTRYLPEDVTILFEKDIQLNISSEADIIEAFGEPYNKDGRRLYYYSEDRCQQYIFTLNSDNDLLYGVTITNELELDGIDTTINPEAPSYLTEYVIPTELGNSVMDTTFLLNGSYYSLPCPISEFLNNGFALEYDSETNIIPAGVEDYCSLELNGLRFNVDFINFSEYATSIENCCVTNISCRAEASEVAWSFTYSPNLQLGTTEAELLTALEGFEYECTESSNTKTYAIYESDYQNNGSWEYINRRNFDVTDGVITTIYITNSINPEFELVSNDEYEY